MSFEVVTIGFGAFMAAIYAAAVVLNTTGPNAFRVCGAAIVVAIGIAHRRIRLERQKEPNALYRKMLATKS